MPAGLAGKRLCLRSFALWFRGVIRFRLGRGLLQEPEESHRAALVAPGDGAHCLPGSGRDPGPGQESAGFLRVEAVGGADLLQGA